MKGKTILHMEVEKVDYWNMILQWDNFKKNQ